MSLIHISQEELHHRVEPAHGPVERPLGGLEAVVGHVELCLLYTSGPKGINYIYGLGGRDVRVESIQHVFAELEKIAATGEVGETYRYLDVRE